MSTLVTGATGFVGSTLVRHLLSRGSTVRIFRRSESRLDLLGGASDLVEHAIGDLGDPDSLLAAMGGIECVYHCAAHLGIGARSVAGRLHEANVRGTRHVVDAALHAGVRRLVATSSIAAIGRPERLHGCVNEQTAWTRSSLNSAYGRSKYLAELEVARSVAEGLDAVVVNPSVVFGIGRPGENTMQVAEALWRGALPAVPPGGTNIVDVEDVAAGLHLAMEHGRTGERYILGGENLTWRTIFDALADSMGVEPPRFEPGPRLLSMLASASETIGWITRRQPRLSREAARYTSRVTCYDTRKAREELSWSPRPFRDTAHRIADHFRSPQ